ncbi:CoA transferase [Spirillospora sp. NPDC052242]
MLLASLGADVVRIERPGEEPDARAWDATRRGRTVVSADLKSPEDVRRVRDLVAAADVLVERFRPGVAERWGSAPTSSERTTRGWATPGHMAARSSLRNAPDGVLAAAAPREAGAEASYLAPSTHLRAGEALRRWHEPARLAAPQAVRPPGS